MNRITGATRHLLVVLSSLVLASGLFVVVGNEAAASLRSDSLANSTATSSLTFPGNKVVFCADNAKIAKAAAKTDPPNPSDILAALRAHWSIVKNFGANAPGIVAGDAQTLITAGRLALLTNDASGLLDSHFFAHAGYRIDAFCGQDSNGSPATSTKAQFCEDNSLIDYEAALINGGSPTPANTLATLKDTKSLVVNFGKVAPSDIKPTAQVLVNAANQALAANSGSPVLTPSVAAAIQSIQTYCGQDSDGVQTGNGPL